jgi:hypothetical protein
MLLDRSECVCREAGNISTSAHLLEPAGYPRVSRREFEFASE